MDFDALLRQLQDWTNKVPLIILGSGASVPFGLPSMWTLGEHLKKSISFTNPDDQAQFDEFIAILDKIGDLEAALHGVQIRQSIQEKIICKTWELINKHDLEAYEQFVEERIDFPLAELTKHLINTTDKKLSIVTTNYDRIAEYAASKAGAFICNGFAQNYLGHLATQIHLNNSKDIKGFTGQVHIWKVHGSLDWFRTQQEQDVHLPMRHKIPTNIQPSIVTPGLSKYQATHLEPYRTIFSQADNAIINANGFLCIGYGFNDAHVHPKLITEIKKNKPIVVISKEITQKTKESIIGNNCKSYVLIEQANTTDTRIYSSLFPSEEVISNVNYWSLGEYLKLIK